MAFARMEATDVNQVVTVRALAIGFRLGAQGSDIEGIVDGFQLCGRRANSSTRSRPTASETVTTLRP
ncbi:Uncharacterised protein [Klebsiella pneumoniae]|uniref:Uncharacterized protein n=1 Tax=Klebsiella pneumoniae TaxID=573 RepID=A0A2X3D127_KLEPN|nr:Uncharacterised protein [Klebsiella pneumoniae]